ncbi:MAG: flagellin [Fimbriimonadaceae bacterium]
MSFRINTNLSAMTALRNVSMTGSEQAKSITRLSTGLRISSAGDDPAGLIASEGFRSQIASLGQAVRNNQDAVNFAKTAEGALDEVNKLLNDARSLAVASANSGSLDSNQLQANQSQLSSIVESVTRISNNTQFGNKKLLNGAVGVSAGISSNRIASMRLSGEFNDTAVTGNSTVTVNVTTAATRGSVASAAFAFGTTTLTAGTFSVNGSTFNVGSGDTVNDVVSRLNAASGSTGVTASYTTGGAVTLTQNTYGADASVSVSDSGAIFLAAAGTSTSAGVDAVASVSMDTNGSASGGLATVTFTGGTVGDGLTLNDNDGNVIKLSVTGNAAAAAFAGAYTNVGTAQFQIGANAGQSTTLSLGNFAASQLGAGAVSGLNLSNLDLTSSSGATNAMSVIDAAISEVAAARGKIGNFQRNTLESSIRSLGVAKENLAATESSIRDVDVAEEMTNFTKLQILSQSGLSMLAQANSQPQSVLSLLR